MESSDPLQIAALDIRCCRAPVGSLGDGLRGGHSGQGLEFLVYTLTTTSGRSASMFGFAGRSALGSGHLAAASLRPFLIGRNALDREAMWHDWRRADRWWHHLPAYSYGPLDCCLWLLAAEAAGVALWRQIGGARTTVPVYASSLVLESADAYAAEALAVQAAGLRGYKIHPPGRTLAEDIGIHRAVRAAVGPDFALMSDPVRPYTYDEALRLGRELERLDFLWLEEPLPDENLAALRELTRTLDIAVIGTEVLARPPYSVAECVATRVVDPGGRRRARRCVVERRRDRRAENRPTGRSVPYAMRSAYRDLSSAGTGEPACHRVDPQLRLVRGAVADAGFRLRSGRKPADFGWAGADAGRPGVGNAP